jgi:hypothetical protein
MRPTPPVENSVFDYRLGFLRAVKEFDRDIGSLLLCFVCMSDVIHRHLAIHRSHGVSFSRGGSIHQTATPVGYRYRPWNRPTHPGRNRRLAATITPTIVLSPRAISRRGGRCELSHSIFFCSFLQECDFTSRAEDTTRRAEQRMKRTDEDVVFDTHDHTSVPRAPVTTDSRHSHYLVNCTFSLVEIIRKYRTNVDIYT